MSGYIKMIIVNCQETNSMNRQVKATVDLEAVIIPIDIMIK